MQTEEVAKTIVYFRAATVARLAMLRSKVDEAAESIRSTNLDEAFLATDKGRSYLDAGRRGG